MELFFSFLFLPVQLSKCADSKATSSLCTKRVGAHEFKKNKQINKTKQTSLSLVEGQRWGGEMGLSSFFTAAENYIKLDAM